MPNRSRIKHYSIIVSGHVQGVFYRASAKVAAERLGIVGFALNDPDGTVYIEAEGPVEALDEFVAWCRQGPRDAEVIDVVITEGHLKQFTDFHTE